MLARGFPCQDTRGCPQRSLPHGDRRFCPCWHDPDAGPAFVEENPQTGEVRTVKGCFFQILPGIMVHVVRASNRPAAEISAMRTEVVEAAAVAVANTLQPLLGVAPAPDSEPDGAD